MSQVSKTEEIIINTKNKILRCLVWLVIICLSVCSAFSVFCVVCAQLIVLNSSSIPGMGLRCTLACLNTYIITELNVSLLI